MTRHLTSRLAFRRFFAVLAVLCLFFARTAIADEISEAVVEDGIAYYDSGDLDTATKIFWRLASQNDARAQYYVGTMLDMGQGMGKDVYNAANWFRKSALAGYVPAMVSMGYAYSTGYGVTKNDKEALMWYTKAATLGEAVAQNNLGIMLRDGLGGKADMRLAAKWFLQSATQGNARAQYNLASFYYESTVAGSDREAWRWYTAAAQQGDIYAETALGTMYLLGQGVKKDPLAALDLYSRAAEKGFVGAQVALARLYETGDIGKKHPSDAALWYARAAQQGNILAQYRLGLLYETGTGLPRDVQQAAVWYKKSVDDGNYLPGLGALCRLYAADKSVSGTTIIETFKKGAERDEAYCQLQLGRAYNDGINVTKDPVLAYQWFALAALKLPEGEDRAGAVVTRINISNALSELQLNEARRRVTMWTPVAAK